MSRVSETESVELNRTVPVEELRPLLDWILSSRHFASAGRNKKFLTVIADYYLNGRADQLNEFCLASEVFGFAEDYEPAGNASVRVCAHDVRKRLREYFEQEGAGERLLIQIPPGAYKPTFIERLPSLPSVQPAPTDQPSRIRPWLMAMALLVELLLRMGTAIRVSGFRPRWEFCTWHQRKGCCRALQVDSYDRHGRCNGLDAFDLFFLRPLTLSGPGRYAGIRSEGTQAAAEFITDPWHSELLQRRLQPNSSAFFQALLRVDVKK